MSENKREVETVKEDVKDGVDELEQRAAAAGERLKRKLAGGEMPLVDRLRSHVNEAAHDAKADMDKANRDARKETP
jgi:hypothetical protein